MCRVKMAAWFGKTNGDVYLSKLSCFNWVNRYLAYVLIFFWNLSIIDTALICIHQLYWYAYINSIVKNVCVSKLTYMMIAWGKFFVFYNYNIWLFKFPGNPDLAVQNFKPRLYSKYYYPYNTMNRIPFEECYA